MTTNGTALRLDAALEVINIVINGLMESGDNATDSSVSTRLHTGSLQYIRTTKQTH